MAFTRSGVRSPSPPLQGWATGIRLRKRRTAVNRIQVTGLRLDCGGNAGIAQLVEHNLAKVGVAGSSPVSRSPKAACRSRHIDAGWSSLVARRAHNPEVVGSNPTPAISDGRPDGRTDGLSCTVQDSPTVQLTDRPSIFGRLAQLVRAPR